VSNPTITPLVGYYGKLPTRGDFVSRGLSRSFIEPMDVWLQQAVAQSQARLGTVWLDKYLDCPFWRFALSAGVCGEVAHFGVLMPSVDNVGRHFPLIVAHVVTGDSTFIDLINERCAWFAHIEQLALNALHSRIDPTQFAAAIQSPGLPERSEQQTTVGINTRLERETLRYIASSLPAAVIQQAHTLSLRDGNCRKSYWWSVATEQSSPHLLCADGLLSPQSYAAMLNVAETNPK
jgi:type VI secretion system protein ImpM